MCSFHSADTASARLERLSIKNFTSIREARIELGKLNVFIGPNASGKSNLLKALRLLRNQIKIGVPTLDEDRAEVPFGDLIHNFDMHKTMQIGAIVGFGGKEEASYILKLSKDWYSEVVAKGAWYEYEKAAVNLTEVLYEYSSGESTAMYRSWEGATNEVSGSLTSPTLVLRDREGKTEKVVLNLHESPLRIPPSDIDHHVSAIAGFLRAIGVFNLSPTNIRLKSEVSSEPMVKYDGTGLARYLLHLYLERRKDFARVEEVVKSLVPEVEEVIPHLEGKEVEIWLRSRDLALPLRPEGISEGTLRLLAMAFILNAGFSVVAIEEPENCVHPSLLEALVDLARKSPSQVIFTTHSPYLLDHIKPEEVFVVGKVGPETRIRKLIERSEIEVVRKYLEEGGTLGEAWYSRLFGDVE